MLVFKRYMGFHSLYNSFISFDLNHAKTTRLFLPGKISTNFPRDKGELKYIQF